MTETYSPEFFADRQVIPSARAVTDVLLRYILQPRSVLDLGCGQGEWLDCFDCDAKLGVDISGGRGIFHDLTEPLDLHRNYALILCLEVAEHLPEESADTLMDTIARHGDDVLFSAAVPGQEGKGHINLQPHDYWHEKFSERGYETLDIIRPAVMDNPDVKPWYRNNVFLYSR